MSNVIKLDKKDIAAISDTQAGIAVLQDKYLPLKINGPDDRAGFDAVYAARQEVKKKRIQVEKTRKELKSNAIEFGRLVDNEAKRITEMLIPIEKHLENEEAGYIAAKAEARRVQEEAAAAKLQSRVDALQAVQSTFVLAMIEKMSDDEFGAMLSEATEKYQDRLAAEEAARIEREQAEAEAARLRAEEEARLASERAEKEAALKAEQARIAEERARQEAAMEEERARLAEERRLHLEEVAKARAEQEALAAKREEEARRIQAEQRELERQRAEIERAEFERQVKLKAEEDARQKLAEEQKQRELDRIAELKRREEEAAYLESIKPDQQKVREYVARVMMAANDIPQVSAEGLDECIERFHSEVESACTKLAKWPK